MYCVIFKPWIAVASTAAAAQTRGEVFAMRHCWGKAVQGGNVTSHYSPVNTHRRTATLEQDFQRDFKWAFGFIWLWRQVMCNCSETQLIWWVWSTLDGVLVCCKEECVSSGWSLGNHIFFTDVKNRNNSKLVLQLLIRGMHFKNLEVIPK